MEEKKNVELTKKKTSKVRARMSFYLLLTLILTVLATIAESFVLKIGYDYRLGVYSATNPIGKITAYFIFVSVLVLFSSAFAIDKSLDSKVRGFYACTVQEAFFASVSGGLVLAYSVMTYLNRFEKAGGSLLPTLILIFSFPMAGYLIFTALSKKRCSRVLTGLGFFPVIWTSVCLLRIYFDRTSAINNPIKIFTQISLVAIMLYFLVELRFRVGRPSVGIYIALSSVASLLGISNSTSLLIAEFTSSEKLSNEVILSFAEFFISFYILMRLVNFVVSMKTKRTLVRGVSQRFRLPDGKTCFKEQKSSDEGEPL